MAITNHERVGKALEHSRCGLGPFVQREMTSTYKDRAATEAGRFIGEDRLNSKKPIAEWDAGVLLKQRYFFPPISFVLQGCILNTPSKLYSV